MKFPSRPRMFLAIAAALLTLCGLVSAQPAPTTQPAAPSAAADYPIHVYLVTFGPGSEAWEKFGHNALWFRDAAGSVDALYNWGVFDFGQGLSGFLSFTGRFIQGKLWYAMEGDGDVPSILRAYADNGRSVRLQELNFTPAQTLALLDRLRANDTDANRHYLYDYYRNNCSTKTRDAIDETVNGRVKAALENLPTGTTYRWHTRRLTADQPVLYLALYYILGQPVDRPLSAWQESFLPARLADHLRAITVPGPAGQPLPLVKSEQLVFAGSIRARDSAPDDFVWGFLAVGAALGGAMVLLAGLGWSWAPARWAYRLLAVAWSLVAGFGGCLALWAWFCTDHTACRYNENVLQCSPLSLLLVVLAPAAMRFPRRARRIANLVLALSLAGLVFKILPWFTQTNREVIALALPAHLGLAAAVAILARRSLSKGPDDDASDAETPHEEHPDPPAVPSPAPGGHPPPGRWVRR